MDNTIRVIIGADIVPTKENVEFFIQKNIPALIGNKLKEVLIRADYRIFNLETPLTNKLTPIKKSGPNLSAPTETVNGFKALGVNLFTLANNHIRDQGISGMNSTKSALDSVGIEYVGLGDNILDLKKYKIIELKGVRIGIYVCTEHEFSIATESRGGANPFDYIETFYDISELKNNSDYVVVLFHGGTELYRYPTPNIQKISRHMVDSGADIVILQHTHCIGAYEDYNNGKIVYGQGNFLFNCSDNEMTNTSLLIQLELKIKDYLSCHVSYYPIEKTTCGVRLADKEKADEVIEQFEMRSIEIQNSDLVKKRYFEFANTKIKEYKYILGGRLTNNKLFRIADRFLKGKLLKFVFSEGYLLFIKDVFMCESNSELIYSNIVDEE